jgi:hypothetical protein
MVTTVRVGGGAQICVETIGDREDPALLLIELDGVGHQLPPPRTWDLVVDALIEHTAETGAS